jgi:TolA-binding protein
LRLAESLEQNHRKDAAKKWYRRIIAEFPRTEAAAKAAARIKSLGS